MLLIFGELAEKQAIEEWSFIEEEPKLRLTTLKLTDFSFNSSEFDKPSLKTGLRVAVKNNPQTGEGSQNGGEGSWGEHFSSKATDAIASSLQTALETLNPASIETPINKFFTDFKKSLDGSLKTAFSSLKAVERRSKLLWWKETLYSITLRKSYREIEKSLLPILMSIDLNKQVPPITPISVDYLLKDTLFLLNQKQDELISFSNYLTEISKEENKVILKPHLSFLAGSEGRISITQFLALLIDDRVKITTFKEKTGIDPTEKITLGKMSVVILHDLLVQRLK